MREKATPKHTFGKGRMAEARISYEVSGLVKIPVPDDIDEEAELDGYIFAELNPMDFIDKIESGKDEDAHFLEDGIKPVNFKFDGDYDYEED